jgi:hypothetical protein
MNKYKSSSATVGVWTPGAWGLESDVFILSCFPAFLILIPVPAFPSLPSFPSVFKNRASMMSIIDRHAGHAGGRSKQKAKLPNEPNLKTAPPAIPASWEGQPEKNHNILTVNILTIITKPFVASEISLNHQKIRSKIMQNACQKHVEKWSF